MDWQAILSDLSRLGAAAGLGGILGLEREYVGHAAGFRTHMMVAVGACIFMMVGIVAAENDPPQLTRIVQGVAAGVGFLGAGTILKLTTRKEIKGLTTAASIWLAAAVGSACAIEEYSTAVAATAMAMLILVVMKPIDWLIDKTGRPGAKEIVEKIQNGGEEEDS